MGKMLSSVLLRVVCTAPLLIWGNVLINEDRAAYQNQSGFQLIRAVRPRSGFSPLTSNLVAQGHRGQKKIHSDLQP